MLRVVIGVIAGYALWTAIWLGGNQVLFAGAAEVVKRGEPYRAAGPLTGILALSVVCSLVAGLVTAVIARKRAPRAVLIMAGLLLVTGVAVQAGVWALMPIWYHLLFLALLIPVAVFGGRLAGRPTS